MNIDTDALERAAKQGDPNAQFTLGAYHAQQQNSVAAIPWLRSAAKQGHLGAQNVLASIYQHGAGVPRSVEEAFRWYASSAEAGSPIAQFHLANMSFSGVGTARDHDVAQSRLLGSARVITQHRRRGIEPQQMKDIPKLNLTPTFVTPFVETQYENCESLNKELTELFLAREAEGDQYKNPYMTPGKVGLFESDFDLFKWPEECVQKLRPRLHVHYDEPRMASISAFMVISIRRTSG